MQPGNYKIKVQAWDVFNNLSSKEVTFKVVQQNNGIVISDIYNYPNPFSSRTTFTFQHNFSDPINVRIKIYTVAGRLIKQIEESNILERFVKIDWNGRDEDNNQIANGTYLYKLIVESSDGNFNNTALGKIAIIR
jgi:flagellar hook assembly protein FlgD